MSRLLITKFQVACRKIINDTTIAQTFKKMAQFILIEFYRFSVGFNKISLAPLDSASKTDLGGRRKIFEGGGCFWLHGDCSVG